MNVHKIMNELFVGKKGEGFHGGCEKAPHRAGIIVDEQWIFAMGNNVDIHKEIGIVFDT